MFGTDTRLAENAVTAAKRRGLPISPDIENAAGMYKVIVDASHDPHPPRPTVADIPATPEQLRARIEEQATAKRHAEYVRSVAADYHQPLASAYNQAVQAAVPGWIVSLQPKFDALVRALAGQAKKLPVDLRVEAMDWNDARISAAWEKAESAAHQLDQLVSDRQDMARAIGGDGGRDNELYAVAKLPDPDEQAVFGHVMRDQIGPAIKEWKELRGQPVSRWLHLARSPHIDLILATPGEVTERAAAMQRWRDAIAAMHDAQGRNGAVTAVRQALAA
ncbi:hypothetical protein ACFYXF_30015 [Streptomyces sp. NPDC002680]|uniref:hypothetical protein n=1 Tax=Streptomyces sp. NPDC002680 TaxID=3364659 RepID=UPI003679F9C5